MKWTYCESRERLEHTGARCAPVLLLLLWLLGRRPRLRSKRREALTLALRCVRGLLLLLLLLGAAGRLECG